MTNWRGIIRNEDPGTPAASDADYAKARAAADAVAAKRAPNDRGFDDEKQLTMHDTRPPAGAAVNVELIQGDSGRVPLTTATHERKVPTAERYAAFLDSVRGRPGRYDRLIAEAMRPSVFVGEVP